MCDQGVGIDRDRAGGLNRIRHLEPKAGAKPCGAFRNVCRKVYDVPGFHHRPITPGERFLASPERPGQDLRDRYRRHGKLNLAGTLPFEKRSKLRRKL